MIEKKNFYINGKWVSPSKPNNFEVIDPSTEEPFAIISLGSIEDTDIAISAAKKAFETWRETSKEKRLSLLEKFDQIIIEDGMRWSKHNQLKWELRWIMLQKLTQKWVLIFRKT